MDAQTPDQTKMATVNIRLLLVSGNQHDLVAPMTLTEEPTTIRYIKTQILQEWPDTWADEPRVTSADDLRIVFQGRFLDDSTPISNLASSTSAPIALHLLPKPAQPRTPDPKEKARPQPRSCCRCMIL